MATPKSRRVELSDEDRGFLLGITRTGSHPAQEVRQAWILLELDKSLLGETGVPSPGAVAARAEDCSGMVVKVTKVHADRGGDVRAAITRAKGAVAPVPRRLPARSRPA